MFLGDSYSLPQAICTGLDSNYTQNNYSSFKVNIVSGYFGSGLLEFYHKYNTDKGNAGGYIETSYDNGRSWSNLVNEGNWREGFYNSDDLIFGHTPAFSGKLEEWEKSKFQFFMVCFGKKNMTGGRVLLNISQQTIWIRMCTLLESSKLIILYRLRKLL